MRSRVERARGKPLFFHIVGPYSTLHNGVRVCLKFALLTKAPFFCLELSDKRAGTGCDIFGIHYPKVDVFPLLRSLSYSTHPPTATIWS